MGCGASKSPAVEPKVTEVKPAKGSKEVDAPISRSSSKVMGSTSSLRKAVQKKKADEEVASSRTRVSEKKGSATSRDKDRDAKRTSSRRSVAHSDSEDDGVVAAPRGNSNKSSRDGSAKSSSKASKSRKGEVDSGNEDEREGSAGRNKKRQTSAGSNSSNADSGFGGDDDRDVITEDHVRSDEVAKANRPPTPEFMLEGRQVGSGKGDRDRDRSDRADRDGSGKKRTSFAKGTKNVAREDRDDLPPRCESRGGCAFDIELDDDEAPSPAKIPTALLPALAPPPSVRRKLAPIKTKPLSQEELELKQAAAEERRKRREREVIERLEARKQQAAQVQTALDSFANKETGKASTIEQKQQAVADNREEHLRALRDRLRAKERHAEEVRRQKREQQAAAATGDDF